MAYNPFPKPVKRQGPSQAAQFFQQEMDDPGGPTVASRFVNNNPQEGLLSMGSNSPDLGMPEKPESVIKFDEHQAQLAAADDGSTTPMAARRYVDAYMADPEWKKAHDSEDDLVEKLAPGIGTMILDRLTRGAYSQGRVRQLEAARLQKRDVEKRYLDIQTREDFLRKDQRDEREANDKLEDAATKRRIDASKEVRDIAVSNAQLGREAAYTKLLGVQTDVAAAGKVVNVPANTSAFTVGPGGKAIPFAQGPNKEWNPNVSAGRDYSVETATARNGRIDKRVEKMQESRDWGSNSPYAGMTDAQLIELAKTQAAQMEGAPESPSANPQYLAPPPGIAKPNPQARSMFLGGNAAPPPPPLEDPNTKRVRIKMNGGNRS